MTELAWSALAGSCPVNDEYCATQVICGPSTPLTSLSTDLGETDSSLEIGATARPSTPIIPHRAMLTDHWP